MLIRVSWDQRLFGSFPRLFAAFRALHRLSAPRHPPHALSSLTAFILSSVSLALHKDQNKACMLPSHCRGTVTIQCSFFSYGCSIMRSSGTCLATGDCHSVHEDALFTATLIVKEQSPDKARDVCLKSLRFFCFKNLSIFGKSLVSLQVR